MQFGCYTLDLYCDHEESHVGATSFAADGTLMHNVVYQQFIGETRDECLRKARRVGWVIGTKVLCKQCSKKPSKEKK